MPLRPVFLATTVCVVALVPFASSAQSIDEAGAQALATQARNAFDQVLQDAQGSLYTLGGDFEAAPNGDRYTLTIPPMVLSFGDEIDFSVPGFTADMVPLDNGWWDAAWDLPSRWELTHPQHEEPRALINFESARNSITVAPEYSVMMDADIALERLVIEPSGGEDLIGAQSFTIDATSEPAGDGPHRFDSEGQIAFTGIDVDLLSRATRVRVGSVTFDVDAQRQRLDLFALLQESQTGMDPTSVESLDALLAAMLPHRDEKWMGGIDFTLASENFRLEQADVTGSFRLFEARTILEGLDEAQSDIGLEVGLEALALSQVPDEVAGLVPSDVGLDITLAEIPTEALMQALYETLDERMGQEELFGPKGRRAGVGIMSNLDDFGPSVLLPVLLASEVRLDLENLSLDMPLGYLTADGSVRPALDAPFQAVGELSIAIAGLPDMIAVIEGLDGPAGELAGISALFVAMGVDDVDADGVPIKRFDLALTQAGELTLNGNDLTPFMALLQ